MTEKKEVGASRIETSAEYKKLYDELYSDPALANLSPKARKAVVEQDPKLILLKWELEKNEQKSNP